jgi:DNA repair protein RAD5
VSGIYIREESLQVFDTDSDTHVLIATIRSAGVGLNLTVASRMIILDPWWNSSVENQAIDRIHRIGQTRDVEVFKLIMSDSIEVKMLEMQKRKADLAGIITGSEEARLSMDELLSFFK